MKDRPDIFERIAASAPADSTAARVTSKGAHYDPSFKSCRDTWDAPPPMKPVPAVPTAQGIVGRRFGRLTVIGLRAEQNQNKRSSWVVRCVCGAYEVRKAAAIRNSDPQACCQRCEAVRRHRENYARFGSRPVEAFTTRETGE
jgi:hypothetical protein